MCYSSAAKRLILSYAGAAFGPQFGNFAGVSGGYKWLLSELADGVFKVNSNFTIASCCDFEPESKTLNLFDVPPDGLMVKYIFKNTAVNNLLDHISKLSKVSLKSAAELIHEFELSNPEMIYADAKIYEKLSADVKKMHQKLINDEKYMECMTLKRFGMLKISIDRIEQYLKQGDMYQTKDLIELKEELRKTLELIKK